MFRPTPRRWMLLLVAVLTLVPAMGLADEGTSPETIKSTDATRYVGKQVTVCGPVAGTGYFPHLKGEPTFINFDRLYPEQSFTVVIWGKFRDQFEQAPDRLYDGLDLCVTGTIETYKGKPQIVVTQADQIEIHDSGLVPERFSYEERVLLKAMLAALGYLVDEGSGEWDAAAAQALLDFQEEQGITEEGGQSPKTIRALAQAVDQVPSEEQQRILRVLLLNLAQREEVAARK